MLKLRLTTITNECIIFKDKQELEEEEWMIATDLTLYSNPLNNALNLGIIRMESAQNNNKSLTAKENQVSPIIITFYMYIKYSSYDISNSISMA